MLKEGEQRLPDWVLQELAQNQTPNNPPGSYLSLLYTTINLLGASLAITVSLDLLAVSHEVRNTEAGLGVIMCSLGSMALAQKLKRTNC